MKRSISTYFFAVVVLLSALGLPSCRRAAEKARRNIRIEAVEQIDRHALSGMDLTVRVHNGSRYKLLLSQAELEVWYAGSCIGSVQLREGVAIPRRTTQSVTLRWKFRIDDPFGLYALARKLRRDDLSQVEVGFRVKGRGGPAAVNIRKERMPLSDFLRIFGIGIDDIKTYMNE